MARHYPEHAGPDWPRSEHDVYTALRALDDAFVVIHSVLLPPSARLIDGEIDFLVAHPDLGLLAMEVKGGERIEYRASEDKWLSWPFRSATPFEIKDPWRQATTSKYALLADFSNSLGSEFRGTLEIGHAVAFPGYTLQNLPAHAKREFTFGDVDLPRLAARVTEAMRYWQSERPGRALGSSGIEAVIHRYAESFTYRIPFAKVREKEDRAVLELTDRQFEIVQSLRRNERVAVEGCAGSGKTVLAVKAAERLGAEGRRVLLVCFNAPLAEHIQAEYVLPPSVHVAHYQALCRALVREARLMNPNPANPVASLRWELDSVISAMDVLGTRYDAVIVDEEQDFQADWLEVLELMREDGAPFFVFYDSHQGLYPNGAVPEWLSRSGIQLVLERNVRNTDQIGRFVQRLYAGTMKLSGRPGKDVVVERFDLGQGADENEWAAVRRIIDGFRRDLRAADEDLIVLSPYGNKSYVRAQMLAYPAYRGIKFETIYRFKGRDHPIVVLAEVARRPPFSEGFDWSPDTLAYVGGSRARHALGASLPADFEFAPKHHES